MPPTLSLLNTVLDALFTVNRADVIRWWQNLSKNWALNATQNPLSREPVSGPAEFTRNIFKHDSQKAKSAR